MLLLPFSVLVHLGHSRYAVTEEACADTLFISTAEECEAAANYLGRTWNDCCQNGVWLPYGCLIREGGSVIWNGNADTPWTFPCTVDGNCAHGMRWAVCRAGYEVTEDACEDDLFISSPEECEAAANYLDRTWNDCCQNGIWLPYGCLIREGGSVIWNGNADTPWHFPCTVDGNCAHGMRWAVCNKGESTVDGAPGAAELSPWTVTLSGKDLLILLLVAINLVTIVAVYCTCAQSQGRGTTKYKAVRTVGDSEMDSEEMSLRQ